MNSGARPWGPCCLHPHSDESQKLDVESLDADASGMAQKALFKSQKKPKPKGPPANRHGKVVKHKGGELMHELSPKTLCVMSLPAKACNGSDCLRT